MKSIVVVGVLSCGFFSLNVWADPFDASIPDASVGMETPDSHSEENDTSGGPCLDSRSCDARTACVNGRCVPTKVRDIGGCSSTAQNGVLALLGAAFAWRLTRGR